MRSIQYYFNLAAKVATPTNELDYLKTYWFGTVGIRSDSTIVYAKNIPVALEPTLGNRMVGNKLIPSHKQKIAHSEYRTLRKLNKWATAMFVVRISKEAHARGNIEYKMARPCENCSSAIVAKEIGRVYYTISDSQYGLFIPGNDSDSIFEF